MNPTGSTAALSPPPVPQNGAYLGAFVNPNHENDVARPESEIPQVAALRSTAGTAPAIVIVYTAWNAPAPISTLTAIVQQGAIPLLSWSCASVSDINAGLDDQTITRYAAKSQEFWPSPLPALVRGDEPLYRQAC